MGPSSANVLTIGLPASPRLTQMLEDRLRLVLLDTLGHHVQNIVHDCSPQFQIELRLYTLLRDGLGNSFRVATFELTSEEISEPTTPMVQWLCRTHSR